MEELGLFVRLGGYLEGEVSPCAPASCLNLPKHFGSLYLEPVFFPHGQKPASAVSVFKQAILRYPCPKIDILVNFWTRVSDKAETSLLRGTTAIRGGSDNMIVIMEKTML